MSLGRNFPGNKSPIKEMFLWNNTTTDPAVCFTPIFDGIKRKTTFINIFSLFFRENKTCVSSESSARQRIHMKIKPYFLRKIKVKN